MFLYTVLPDQDLQNKPKRVALIIHNKYVVMLDGKQQRYISWNKKNSFITTQNPYRAIKWRLMQTQVFKRSDVNTSFYRR